MKSFAKAMMGGLAAGLAALAAGLEGDVGLSAYDIVVTALAVVTGFNAVYWTRNVPEVTETTYLP
jgi:hypothetical protein